MVKPVVNANMNATLREVVGRFVGAAPNLSHKQTVQRLYKKSLKTLDSWVIDRRLWNEEATKIRAQFDSNEQLDPNSGCVGLFLVRGIILVLRILSRSIFLCAFLVIYLFLFLFLLLWYCYFRLAKRLVREAQEKVDHYTHPDRYIFNYMPGGSLYMRNAPIPLDVCFPDGEIPDDVELSPLEGINIDMTPLPAKETVFVDFSKKGYD